MPEQEITTNEIKNTLDELVEFLQENMATKDDIKNLDQKIDHVYSSLSSQIHSVEIELEDIKKRLDRLEKRTIEDADAAAKDILELRKRVEILERRVGDLQPA